MRLPYRKGVGAALFNARGLVFIARRIDARIDAQANPSFAPAWQMPQGGIDKGEDPQSAVLRELKEETGTDKAVILAETGHWLRYDLPGDLTTRVWGGRYRGQEQKWFALRFTGDDGDIDLEAGEEPEFSDWKWAPLSSIPDLIVPFKRPLYEEIVTQFSRFAVSVPEPHGIKEGKPASP